MKKLIVLALCLVLALGAFCLGEAGSGYQVGDAVDGFTVTDVRDFDLLGARLTTFVHDRTGATVLLVKNSDTDRVFDITFRTVAEDSTGTPHVFEHATLDGSAKYPSRELFFNLSYQTYNTYMNASTYPYMTTYPVASLSEAQLLKYADYYLDSCFNPTLMEDSSIFDEEAWRYSLTSADSDLTITGTVYNEMLGSYTIESAAYFNSLTSAFPGSTAGNVSGGKPSDIPELTYEAVCAYHEKYYHPSNSLTVLYGDIEDPDAFLSLLDGVFSAYEKRDLETEGVFDDAGYTPLTESKSEYFPYPAEEGANTEDASEVYLTYICPGADEYLLENLTTLIDYDSFAFQQLVKEKLPGVSASCYCDSSTPEPCVVFTASGLDTDEADAFAAVVREALDTLAQDGFDQDVVDSMAANISLSTRLTAEEDEVGVNVIPSIAYYWATGGDLYGYMTSIDAMCNIAGTAKTGAYQAAIVQYLSADAVTDLAVTYPVPGMQEIEDAALNQKLSDVKAAMTEDEIAALVNETNTEESGNADTAQMVASLTAVTVDSLPEDIRLYDVVDETGEDGVRRLYVPANVDGVGVSMIRLDLSGMSVEELKYMQLYLILAGDLDTSSHTSAELTALLTRWCYDAGARIVLPDDDSGDGFTPYLHLNFTALDDELAQGWDVMRELLFDTQLDDAQAILNLVDTAKTSLRRSINNNGLSVLLERMISNARASDAMYYTLNFLDYYQFLCDVESQLSADPQPVLDALKGVQDYLMNAGCGAITGFAGDEAGYAEHTLAADAFIANLGSEQFEKHEYTFDSTPMSEALITDTNTSYNLVFASWEDLGVEEGYTADLDALCAFMDDQYLMPLLRDERGAYGAYIVADIEGIYLYSYRDPNVQETFTVFSRLSGLLAKETDVTQDTVDGYILSSYSAYATPEGELTGAYDALRYYLTGYALDRNATYMQQLKSLKAEDIASYSTLIKNVMLKGRIGTVSSASVINANSSLFSNILDPFDAASVPEITLSDVHEGDNGYEAIRWCVDEDLMSIDLDGNFCPDAAATLGDVAAPLAYAASVTDGDDQQEAIEALAAYGIIDDYDADYAINRSELSIYLANFYYACGGEFEDDYDVSVYSDAGSIDEDTAFCLGWCVTNGLIWPTDAGALAPEAGVTRAELANTLYTFFNQMW